MPFHVMPTYVRRGLIFFYPAAFLLDPGRNIAQAKIKGGSLQARMLLNTKLEMQDDVRSWQSSSGRLQTHPNLHSPV